MFKEASSMAKAQEVRKAMAQAPSEQAIDAASLKAKKSQERYVRGELTREAADRALRYRPLNSVLFASFDEMKNVVRAMHGDAAVAMLERGLGYLVGMDEKAKEQGFETEIGLTVKAMAGGGFHFVPYVRVLLGEAKISKNELSKVKKQWGEIKTHAESRQREGDISIAENALREAMTKAPDAVAVNEAAVESRQVITEYIKGKIDIGGVQKAMRFEYPNVVYFSNVDVMRESFARVVPGPVAAAAVQKMIEHELEHVRMAQDLGLECAIGVYIVRLPNGSLHFKAFSKVIVDPEKMSRDELARVRRQIAGAPKELLRSDRENLN